MVFKRGEEPRPLDVSSECPIAGIGVEFQQSVAAPVVVEEEALTIPRR